MRGINLDSETFNAILIRFLLFSVSVKLLTLLTNFTVTHVDYKSFIVLVDLKIKTRGPFSEFAHIKRRTV